MASNSGNTTLVIPSSYPVSNFSGCPDTNNFVSSTCILSALISSKKTHFSLMASFVFSSNSKFNWALKRSALKIRNASSSKRSFASPTQRKIPCSKSSFPPNKSTRPSVSLYAMALMVKSLRFKSSFKEEVKVTPIGLL